MLGLPTETDEDVLGIADLAYKVLQTWRENATNKKRGCNITVSTSFFVPKSNTPFQWEAQITPEEYLRRQHLLKDAIKNRSISYHWHESNVSFLEAVLTRGDRKLCDVLETAVKNGAKLDGWNEYFSFDTWMNAFETCGVDPKFYAQRTYGKDEIFPWQTISVGVRRDFLWHEREQAYRSVVSPDCRKQCTGCGANLLYKEGVCDE
jgi:radical SAM superfamily enzyme YgiQ (UPF0313 family)